MADLAEINSSQSVKVAGANPSTGTEDNYMEVNSDGTLNVRIKDTAGTGLTSTLVGSKQSLDVNVSQQVTTSDKTANGTIGALNATLAIALNGCGNVSFQITGTWVGTITYEGTVDGTNWSSIICTLAGFTSPFTTTLTANGLYRGLAPAGLTQVRLRFSAYTSGTATIVLNASSASNTNIVFQGNAANLLVTAIPSDSTKTTYSASASGFATALLATDIWTITGSASKVIRITRIEISATTTSGAGASVNCLLIKRSTADSGGVTVADTIVPHDSTNAAGTATVNHYTANPVTLGVTVGTVRSTRLEIPTVGGAGTATIWTFGDRPTQTIVLRGTGEQLAINLSTTTLTGPAVNIDVEWTEE